MFRLFLRRRALSLTAIVFAAFLLANAKYVFRTELHEDSDFAANSLQVINAKRFNELLGNYSRFGFHHPGPAFFYVYALGEAVFHDALHLVPTPFNGQKIALYALTAFFFSAAIVVFAKRLGGDAGRRWFIPLALLFAAFHFGAVGYAFHKIGGDNGFLSSWQPCVLIAPFLCFLIAAASVATGGGKHLPLMVLAGCFLVHGHVAQPLFVAPLTLLAYGCLLLHQRRAAAGAAWISPARAFRREHWIAAGLIALFVLPIAIDFAIAEPNNVSLIINHVHAHRGEHKELLRSVLYFLHFGAYTAYPNPAGSSVFGAYDAAGMILFFKTHWRVYSLWAATIMLPALLLAAAKLSARPTNSATRFNQTTGTRFERHRFLGSMYLMLGAAVGLTLLWACIQDGPMFYFNTLFAFAIYYVFTLLLAAAAAITLERWLPSVIARGASPRSTALVHTVGPWLIAAAATAAFASRANAFRAAGSGIEAHRVLSDSIGRAVEAQPIPALKFLRFDHAAWPIAIGVALQLERRGQPWCVANNWGNMFGYRNTVDRLSAERRNSGMATWRLMHRPAVACVRMKDEWTTLPLMREFVLTTDLPPLNPDSDRISFAKDGNCEPYIREGWSSSEGDWSWSEAPVARLHFRPLPASTDVEMRIDAYPFLVPPKLTAQRLEVLFNDVPLAVWNLQKREVMKVQIPATLWNAAAEGHLVFRFPDASAPRSFDVNNDTRLLGVGFHYIDLRLLP